MIRPLIDKQSEWTKPLTFRGDDFDGVSSIERRSWRSIGLGIWRSVFVTDWFRKCSVK